jgi:predicted nucleotidyltransferase component of viral defense system
MIPEIYINDWEKEHPWRQEYVEQDLILSRAIVEMFSNDLLRKSLVFRGGTALHKLFIHPQARYSEDIDLIQINREPINPVLKRIREVMSFLGAKRTVKQHVHNNTMIYRFDTEIPPVMNMRLKIEINTREHLNVLGLQKIQYEVKNEWFSGACDVTVYTIEEMLGSKLKALYGRKKGRDLFDLYWAFTHLEIDSDKLLHCNRLYYEHEGQQQPTAKQFLRNMEEKLTDNEFIGDIYSILKPEVEYNQLTAYELIKTELIEKM